jgi:hypothetical protein
MRYAWLCVFCLIHAAPPAQGQSAASEPSISCDVYPALPDKLSAKSRDGVSARREGNSVLLTNDYLTVRISAAWGVITAIENKLTGQRFDLDDDQVGLEYATGDAIPQTWVARSGLARDFAVTLHNAAPSSEVVLANRRRNGPVITYRLHPDEFWVERKIKASGDTLIVRRLIYGRLQAQGSSRMLKLGKYDRPTIISREDGGLFGGIAGWFYAVGSDGIYENRAMNYDAPRGGFESEPWYVGVFKAEPGESYPGWLWYRTFLQMRKSAHDKQKSWSYWNAGWGQWGVEIDDPSAKDCIELARKLGVRSIAFGSGGSGKGLHGYVESANTNPVARENLDFAGKSGIGAGFLDSSGLKERWADPISFRDKMQDLEDSARAGYRAIHFDFFSAVDTFTAHRNVAEYFRHAREKMDYTECHLGMAEYGPQFQREVLLNHPTDLAGFDISRFSSDWATFLGFRHSRAEWQRRYDYLIPEYGLYYFLTHYSNHGHPRRYTDPEPQQLLYGPQAYCGLAYNFHDVLGFREVLAAASAFSPYFVFGYLDLKMPERDGSYARRFFQWVDENIGLLRLGRICFEDSNACVVSKVRGNEGAIYCLNYGPTRRQFKLKLHLGGKMPATLRQVYPVLGKELRVRDAEDFVTEVRGESVAILSLNDGLKTLPPTNESQFPIDVAGWSRSGAGFTAAFKMPDIRQLLTKSTNQVLPKLVLSLDELQESTPELVDKVRVSPESPLTSVLAWIGRGRLPVAFKKAYGFKDRTVETWRLAPWAFADRAWLVYRPAKPVNLTGKFPQIELNGKKVELYPRVDYRGAEVTWNCPLFFADITNVCGYGEANPIVLSGVDEPGNCYVTTAADRR